MSQICNLRHPFVLFRMRAITGSKYAPSGLTDCTQKESTSDDMPSVYVLAYIAIIYRTQALAFTFSARIIL